MNLLSVSLLNVDEVKIKKYNRLVKVAAKHLRNMGVSESGPRISRKLKSLGNPVFSSLFYICILNCLGMRFSIAS